MSFDNWHNQKLIEAAQALAKVVKYLIKELGPAISLNEFEVAVIYGVAAQMKGYADFVLEKHPVTPKRAKDRPVNTEEAETNWTTARRLKIIQALAARSLDGPRGETHAQLMQRILFLCDMPPEFLELNKANYEDAIKLANAGFTVSL
jgi:hypothetical protein